MLANPSATFVPVDLDLLANMKGDARLDERMALALKMLPEAGSESLALAVIHTALGGVKTGGEAYFIMVSMLEVARAFGGLRNHRSWTVSQDQLAKCFEALAVILRHEKGLTEGKPATARDEYCPTGALQKDAYEAIQRHTFALARDLAIFASVHEHRLQTLNTLL